MPCHLMPANGQGWGALVAGVADRSRVERYIGFVDHLKENRSRHFFLARYARKFVRQRRPRG